MKQKYFEKINQPYWIYFSSLIVPMILLISYLIFVYGITLTSIISFIVSYVIIYIYGTSLFYHRYWSHRQFHCHPWLVKFFTVAGLFGLNNGPVLYTLVHRYHHQHTDTDLDPHTPLKGRWFAFMGWLFQKNPPPLPLRLIKDLLHDDNAWVLKVDAYKIYIIHAGVLLSLLIDPKITIGLIFGMFSGLLIELLINAFAHNVKTKKAMNTHPIITWLTAGGTLHEHHHDKSAVCSKDDPGYYFVKLIGTIK